MTQVYCAGPLFNESERNEMAEIAAHLEAAGYTTFLPHRDGLEFARLSPEFEALGVTAERANAVLQRAIFQLDVYELLAQAEAVVVNLNGRVPDEGAVVEASLAWHAAKALVLYKTDVRTVLGGFEHPMVVGLGGFRVVDRIEGIADAVRAQLQKPRHSRVQIVLERGKQIAVARQISSDPSIVARSLLAHDQA